MCILEVLQYIVISISGTNQEVIMDSVLIENFLKEKLPNDLVILNNHKGGVFRKYFLIRKELYNSAWESELIKILREND